MVRVAESRDLASLLGLYGQLAEDRPDALPASASDAAPIFEAIVSASDRALLVATLDGAVVGTADMVVVSNLTHGARPWAAVENVVVDEAHRGAGVGRSLMVEVLRRCEASGCFKVQLLSRRHRHDAHRFYRGLGFEPSAEGFRLYLEAAPGAPGPGSAR